MALGKLVYFTRIFTVYFFFYVSTLISLVIAGYSTYKVYLAYQGINLQAQDNNGGDTGLASPQSPLTPLTPTATVLPTVRSATPMGERIFTKAELARYNKPSRCYVAYKGVVYDVTAHPSWRRCRHHGVRGGRDITAAFPHPISYLKGLPKKGRLK